MKIATIKLDRIDAPRDDDRLSRSPEAINTLATSIARDGLTNPPTVEGRGARFECITGWTRILACRQLAWATIPANIHPPLTDAERGSIRFGENVDRENLTAIEEARRLSSMLAAGNLTIDALAARLHRSTDWVVQRLNLLALPEELQAHVHLKSLSIGAALALGQVTDPQHLAYLLRYALDAGATVATVQAWVNEWKLHHASGATTEAPLPPMPMLNQPHTVHMPCARCHLAHDVRESCIIRVCQPCGREIEDELRHQAPVPPHDEPRG